MKGSWLVALAAVVTLPLLAAGGAASPQGAAAVSNPALALAALDRKIADLDAAERSDRLEIDRVGALVGATRARVLSRGRAFYKLTRAGLLPVGGGFDMLVTYAMRVERVRRLLTADVDEEVQLHARAIDLSAELDRIARDRAGAGDSAHRDGRGAHGDARREPAPGGLRQGLRDVHRRRG